MSGLVFILGLSTVTFAVLFVLAYVGALPMPDAPKQPEPPQPR